MMRKLLRLSLRAYRYRLLGCAMIITLFTVLCYNPGPPTSLAVKLRAFILSRKESSDRRPQVFYPWIDNSGRTLNGTKPPLYGIFVLLDLQHSSSYVTSQRGEGDSLVERLTDHDFGFASCHQVKDSTLYHIVYTIWIRQCANQLCI